MGTRYGGNLARLCAVIVLTVASFTYVTAQINATGTIASVALDIDFKIRCIYWTNKYFTLFNVRGYESGNLDTGCTIYRTNYSLLYFQFFGSVTKWGQVSSLTSC